MEADPDCMVIAPASEFPIEIVPFEVPVLIDVAKLEVLFKETAPPETVKPVCPVNSPPEVIVPVPEVYILPDVVIRPPVVAGESVGGAPPSDCQYPTTPVPPLLIAPVQVKSPVVSLTVQPNDAEPPANWTFPPAPGFRYISVVAVAAEITGAVPAKVRAVDVKVLELMVDEKVADPATDNVPVPVVEIPPEVVMESPVVAGERVVPTLDQNPDVPVEPPLIFPEHVRSPVVSLIVQPVEAAPPARSTFPPIPGFNEIFVNAVDAEIVGAVPVNVKAVEEVVAPLAITVARVSASVPVTVIVVPTAETELIPPPAMVNAPAKELREVTAPVILLIFEPFQYSAPATL